MKKIGLILLPIIAIVLEALPYGTVLVFASSPTERIRETFSFFSFTPFAYANFTPFITAILTCVILLLALISIKKSNFVKYIFLISLCGAMFSLMPLLFGIEYFTPVSGIVAALLIGECSLARSLM